MKLDFLASKNENFEVFLKESLSKAQSLDWAVAFGTQSAFNLLRDDFYKFFKEGGVSRAVFDLSSGFTDPELIEELITYPGSSKCKVFVGNSKEGIFHHKLYMFNFGESAKVYLGSSNFTTKAFKKNHESGFLATINHESDLYSKVKLHFEEKIWNLKGVVSPENDEGILKLYKDIYSLRIKSEYEKNKKLTKLSEKIEDVYLRSINFDKLNPETSYLIGLLCASVKYINQENIKQRTINIHFISRKRGKGIDSGFLCARGEDGNLLGNIRLPQVKTQISTLNLITNNIKNLIDLDSKDNHLYFDQKTNLETGYVNIKITINFSEKSKIWNLILSTLDQFELKNNTFIPNIPKEITESNDKNIKKKFLKGYFDLRGRVSSADKYPNGKFRLSTQINTHHLNYLEQLAILLNNTLGIQAQINYGSKRDKDNMIRFDPTENSLELFDGWKKILVDQFIRYNKSNF